MSATPPAIVTPNSMSAGLLKIPSLLEVGVNEVEHVMLYGETGTGKTTLAALLSEFYNVLWFDGDKGLTAAVNNCHPKMLERIRVIKIPDNTKHPIMVSTMLKAVTGDKINICTEHGSVDCVVCRQKPDALRFDVTLNDLTKDWVVVMDSQTQFYASCLAFAYYKTTGNKAEKDVPADYKGDWDYRGIAYQCAEKFGNYMKDLRCQWVSISHEVVAEMDDEVTKKVVPVAGSRNVSSNYGRWFGTMVYAKKANNRYNYMSSGLYSATVQTKSRTNVVLEKQTVPSLLHVFRPSDAESLLKGSYNEWFLTEGYKPIKERAKGKEHPPTPKDILQP